MTRNELREYKKLNKEINEMQKRLDTMKKDFIGEANESGVYSYDWSDMGYKVSECKRTVFDTKAFQQDHPELYNKYVSETVYQQFRTH